MADIGERLRTAREAKGLTLGDIERITKIQIRYLTAIEDNEFDKLPGEFYVRAFIRQYAQVVGLDGKELLEDYHDDVPAPDPDEYAENSIDNKSEEVKKTTNPSFGKLKNALPKIAIGAGVVLVVLVIWIVVVSLNQGASNHTQEAEDVTVSSSSSTAKPKKKASTIRITDLGNGVYRVRGINKDSQLVIQMGDTASYAEVTVDGQVQLASTLNAGQRQTIAVPADTESISVNIPTGAGATLKIAGKKVPVDTSDGTMLVRLVLGNASANSGSTQGNTNSSTTETTNQNSQQSEQTTQNNSQTSGQTGANNQTNNNQNTTNSGTTNSNQSTSNSNQGSQNGGQ